MVLCLVLAEKYTVTGFRFKMFDIEILQNKINNSFCIQTACFFCGNILLNCVSLCRVDDRRPWHLNGCKNIPRVSNLGPHNLGGGD